jgi:hypothetical protein
MKKLSAFCAIIISISCIGYCLNNNHQEKNKPLKTSSSNSIPERIKTKAGELKVFAIQKKYNTQFALLADMQKASGSKRLYLYSFKKDTIITAGLMAHGSCNTAFLAEAKFSNQPDCGCSSLGKYAIGYKYKGKFGEAYKLYGLDSSNSNAFNRFIVLHGYHEVPNEATKEPICNSLGCPMVSHQFFAELDKYLLHSSKPILLWMFN